MADLYVIDTGTVTRTVTREHLEHIIEMEWGKVGKARSILYTLDSGAVYNTGVAKVRKLEAMEK